MIKFIKDISLSIDLLNLLGDKPMRIVDIAPNIGTSKFYLERVVRKLNHNNLVKSAKGRGGGVVSLNKDVTLYDIVMCFYDLPDLDLNTESGRANSKYIETLKLLYVFTVKPVTIKTIKSEPTLILQESVDEVLEEIDDIDLGSW